MSHDRILEQDRDTVRDPFDSMPTMKEMTSFGAVIVCRFCGVAGEPGQHHMFWPKKGYRSIVACDDCINDITNEETSK